MKAIAQRYWTAPARARQITEQTTGCRSKTMSRTAAQRRPRVVIIGAGFGGLSATTELANSDFGVMLIDRHNYHLFHPLLYQVATAGLSLADIASPIRAIMRRAQNVNVVLAQVSDIAVEAREVLAEGRRIPFDILIVATGARHAYFGQMGFLGSWPQNH
jgi:NADH dehydrogenase